MKYFIFAFFLLFQLVVFAQIDSGGNKTMIPPAGTLAPKTTTVKPEDKKFDTPNPDTSPLENTKPFNMFNKEQFVDANQPHTQRLQQQADRFKPKRIKQSLGSIKTKSQRVTIRYRDGQEVDNDQIRISLNGEPIIMKLTLGSSFSMVDVKLETGFNYIDFQAVDEGFYSPTTAEYEVLDQQGVVIFSTTWGLSVGDTASLVITREK